MVLQLILDSQFNLRCKKNIHSFLRDSSYLYKHFYLFLQNRWLIHKENNMFYCTECNDNGLKVSVGKYPQSFYEYIRKSLSVNEKINIKIFRILSKD